MTGMRVGVLGLGSIGMRHARNLKQLGHQVLGYDPLAAARNTFSQGIGCPAANRDEILARADAVVIATPNAFHLTDLRDTVEAGKPALVEKPLGHDSASAAVIVQRAERKGLAVAVAQNLRFRAVVRRLREIVREGRVGQPVWAHFLCASWLPDWRSGSDYRKNYAADPETGGVIFDCIHELDLAVHILGPADLSACVAGTSGLLDIASDDMADVMLTHRSGCRTHIHLDYITRVRQRQCKISGTQGLISADLRRGTIFLVPSDGGEEISEEFGFDPDAEYLAEIENFLSALAGKVELACPASDALRVLALACAARERAGLPATSPEATQMALS